MNAQAASINADAMSRRGLSPAEVEASRRLHGTNRLTPPAREPWWRLLIEKFDDPIIRILMMAAFISLVVGAVDGQYTEALGIITAIVLATTLAFINEFRANREFDILNQVSDEVPFKVIRDGRFCTVPMWELVVGDLVLLEVGEEVPADGVLLEGVTLQVDESRLTGESMPVGKEPLPVGAAAGEPSRPAAAGAHEGAYGAHQMLRGTMIGNGRGLMQVTAVGDATEIGKTARAAAEETGDQTPLDRQLERLSKVIGVIGFGVAAILYVSLVFSAWRQGELPLQPAQWYVVGVVIAGVVLALRRVWMPIAYDACEIVGVGAEAPAWLEQGGVVGWLKTVGAGVLFVAVGLGAAVGFGQLSAVPGTWLPAHAGREFLEFFIVSVTIIVVAVPEGLAMSVTLSLAYSMRKMTAAHNLVRRMHACETIGAATVICSDKTGTLTRNEMRVAEVVVPSVPDWTSADKSNMQAIRFVAEAIAANSTANLSRMPGAAPTPLGNPTEGALLLWLDEQGYDYLQCRMGFRVLRQWTFSTEHKFMATSGESGVLGKTVLQVKGAPEIVLERCARILLPGGVVRALSDDDRVGIDACLRGLQGRGMRTLGLAFCDDAEAAALAGDLDAVARDLCWLGCIGIADPVRPEVPAAIAACRRAGVGVKVVTGDTAATAQEIARHIGLVDPHDGTVHHLSGPEFGKLSDDEARRIVGRLCVLSRARPMDKLRLVRLLKEAGQVVAVTGDGTNDAPALNYANVGLAMGKTGTAVAKEASDIILLDDSFPSIVNAVMWGRSLYLNLQRFIVFQLTINVTALVIALVGPFIGIRLPLTVPQILWVNLIMDTFAALALATEPPNPRVMDRPPRNPDDFIITPEMARAILVPAAAFLFFLIGYIQDILQGGVTMKEYSVFFTVFVMMQFWNLFNARCLGTNQSAFANVLENRGFLAIVATIFVGQVLFVQFGGTIFRTEPLTVVEWMAIVGGTSVVLWLGELWRFLRRRGLFGGAPTDAAVA